MGMSEERKRVSHEKRAQGSGPAHVVLRLRKGLPSMRTPRLIRVIERVIRTANDKNTNVSIIEYSVMSNHVHMFVEADDPKALGRGMQGFMIRFAKAVNKSWKRCGTVFSDRYYAGWVKTVDQVHRVIRYVLQNARKHGIPIPAGEPDPYSSGPWFRSWHGYEERSTDPPPVNVGQCMVTYVGTGFPVGIDEMPGPCFV